MNRTISENSNPPLLAPLVEAALALTHARQKRNEMSQLVVAAALGNPQPATFDPLPSYEIMDRYLYLRQLSHERQSDSCSGKAKHLAKWLRPLAFIGLPILGLAGLIFLPVITPVLASVLLVLPSLMAVIPALPAGLAIGSAAVVAVVGASACMVHLKSEAMSHSDEVESIKERRAIINGKLPVGNIVRDDAGQNVFRNLNKTIGKLETRFRLLLWLSRNDRVVTETVGERVGPLGKGEAVVRQAEALANAYKDTASSLHVAVRAELESLSTPWIVQDRSISDPLVNAL